MTVAIPPCRASPGLSSGPGAVDKVSQAFHFRMLVTLVFAIMMTTLATATRWLARSLSALILLFWGVLIVAHIFGTEGRGSRPLVWQDYFIFATLGIALLALAISWRRELAGAVLTIVAIGLCATVNLNVLMFPGTLIPLAALLFAASALLRRNKPEPETAASVNS